MVSSSGVPPSHSAQTASSSSSSGTRITLPVLQQKLKETLCAQAYGYSRVSAFLTLWDDDDTGAQEDANKLQDTLKDLLGIASTVFTLPSSSQFPRYELRKTLNRFIDEEHQPNPQVHTLLIFAYIGHGVLGGLASQREVHFTSKGDKKITWSQALNSLSCEPQIDVFAILDCCHSGARQPKQDSSQTITALAACGPLRKLALANQPVLSHKGYAPNYI